MITVPIFNIQYSDKWPHCCQLIPKLFQVEACQKHAGSVKWSKAKVNPGDPVNFKVAAGDNSRCGVSATDKSAELLGNPNKVTKERIGKLLDEISQRKTRSRGNIYYYRDNCPDVYNSIKVFESTGIDIITNIDFVKHCETINDAINATKYEPHFESSIAFSAGGPPQPVAEEAAFGK